MTKNRTNNVIGSLNISSNVITWLKLAENFVEFLGLFRILKFSSLHGSGSPTYLLQQKKVGILGALLSPFGPSRAFCLVFVPLEYIPNIPPHFTYIIVFLSEVVWPDHRCVS